MCIRDRFGAEGWDCEVIDKKMKTEVLEVEDEATGDILEISEEMLEATVKCSKPRMMPRIVNVPPEEFYINEGAVSINDDVMCRFAGHWFETTVSDVYEQFPDFDEDAIYELSEAGASVNQEYEKAVRHSFDDTYDHEGYHSTQKELGLVRLMEAFIRFDYDEDGVAEWRHVFMAGTQILSNEEWFGPLPFCHFTPFKIPHKFYGLGLWDKLRDYHRTKTGLVRAAIDAANQRNTTRFFADPRHVNLRDLKSGKPGIVSVTSGFDPQSVLEIPKPSGGPGDAVSLLQYLDKEIIAQIGIDPVTGVISTDVEKSGNDAAKTAQVIDNASAKIETMARALAETGMRNLIWTIYDMMVQNGQMEDLGMLKSHLTAKVGLGHQTAVQRAQAAQAIIQQQLALESSPTSPIPVPPKYKLAAARNFAESLGEEDPSLYFPSAEEIEQAQAAQAQQQAQLLQAQQQAAQVGQQDTLQNSEAKRKLEDAKAREAEVKACLLYTSPSPRDS